MPSSFARLCVLVLALMSASRAMAEDWPQWRGADRTDRSPETGLLKEWPKDGPPQVWIYRDCGLGYSGVAVVGNQLFTMGARDGKEMLICVDVTKGEQLWAAEVGNVLANGWGDGPRSTPTVDGEFVYALGGEGDIVCAKCADGSVAWRKKLQDFGGSVPNWGYTESVLVDGDRLVCTPGGDQGTVLALNKTNGEKIWQSADIKDPAHYASPIIAEHNGIRQYIQLTEKSVLGVNAETGALVWRADWPGKVAVIPTPIFHEGSVYVTAGYGVGCNLFRIDENNQAHAVYSEDNIKVMKNHHGGVILLDKHIFGHSDSVGWVCQDLATGEQKWRERSALGKGAVTYADGMLYCVAEEGGEVALVEASTEGFSEKSRFTLTPQTEKRNPKGRIWTHPVIANGKLYLRDQDLLFCFDVKQK